MSLITTNNGRIVLKKAESMMVVPYVYNSTVGDYILGSDVYDLSAIIGDSITIEQDDGDKTTKENEFVASPLIECVSGAKYGFTAQCIDLQNAVLKSCFNAMTSANNTGAVAFNDDFTLLYAAIRIRFKDTDKPDVVLPKVQMNSKLFINQLKTRLSQGNLAGTAKAVNFAVSNAAGTSALQFNVPVTSGTTYTPYTPVSFVPQANTPLFFHHKGSGSTDVYSKVNFENGTVTTVNVNRSSGTIS